MKSHWMEYKGKRVFIAEYSHFGDDSAALKQEVDEAVHLLALESEHSALVVVNMEGTNGTVPNSNVLKKLLPISSNSVKRRAILGMSGMKHFFLATFAHLTGKGSLTPFDSLDQALEWIIAD